MQYQCIYACCDDVNESFVRDYDNRYFGRSMAFFSFRDPVATKLLVMNQTRLDSMNFSVFSRG